MAMRLKAIPYNESKPIHFIIIQMIKDAAYQEGISIRRNSMFITGYPEYNEIIMQ